MRLEGTIRSWNVERGFGFIAPVQGGQGIFVHIKAFSSRGTRPEVGQAVTFEVEPIPYGRTRARAVELMCTRGPAPRQPARISSLWRAAGYLAIPASVAIYLTATVLWQVPGWVAALYAIASLVAFGLYVIDKSAAIANSWRVSESALLVVGLLGGWPGAIAAQQLLRHKSSKATFRSAFWGTVLLNVVGFLVAASPLTRNLLHQSLSPSDSRTSNFDSAGGGKLQFNPYVRANPSERER
jgi:uncharacterized membrane protein YsdA (DUF1294 family)/cold shock CspA family protein